MLKMGIFEIKNQIIKISFHNTMILNEFARTILLIKYTFRIKYMKT